MWNGECVICIRAAVQKAFFFFHFLQWTSFAAIHFAITKTIPVLRKVYCFFFHSPHSNPDFIGGVLWYWLALNHRYNISDCSHFYGANRKLVRRIAKKHSYSIQSGTQIKIHRAMTSDFRPQLLVNRRQAAHTHAIAVACVLIRFWEWQQHASLPHTRDKRRRVNKPGCERSEAHLYFTRSFFSRHTKRIITCDTVYRPSTHHFFHGEYRMNRMSPFFSIQNHNNMPDQRVRLSFQHPVVRYSH